MAAIAVGLAGALAAAQGARILLRAIALTWGAVRFAYRLATLTALRRCPDCRRLINAQATVCRHCGRR